jgi:hypothetical protein
LRTFSIMRLTFDLRTLFDFALDLFEQASRIR